MKKCILLIVVMLPLLIAISGQAQKLEVGVQGGKNFSSADGPGLFYGNAGTLYGLTAGGHLRLQISKHFAVKTLLSYDQFGWTYRSLTYQNNASSNIIKADMLSKLNYLNMPVLAEFSFGRKVKFNLDCGVFLGVLLSNKYIIKYYQPETSEQAEEVKNLSDKYHRLNFGLSLGCGMQIPVTSKIKLEIDLRNHSGISNAERVNGTGNHQILTNTFAITGGFSFAL